MNDSPSPSVLLASAKEETDILPHPQWAREQASKLLYALSVMETYEEKVDMACLFLRTAYHLGGVDTCNELRSENQLAGSEG